MQLKHLVRRPYRRAVRLLMLENVFGVEEAELAAHFGEELPELRTAVADLTRRTDARRMPPPMSRALGKLLESLPPAFPEDDDNRGGGDSGVAADTRLHQEEPEAEQE